MNPAFETDAATPSADVVAGDEVAFARLIARYDDDLVRVAYLVIGDVGLAREAAQSAWALAWRRLPGLRDPARIRPWLVAISVNEARQLLLGRRRTSVREIYVADIEDSAPSRSDPRQAGSDASVRWLDLAAAMRRLSEEDRAIVSMRYAIGLTSEEIGQAMRLSPGTVRTRLSRALARLRKDLGDDRD